MILPKWIEDYGVKGCKCGWTNRSHKWFEALTIAWEALEDISNREFDDDVHTARFVASEALHRIAELGGESRTTIEELGK